MTTIRKQIDEIKELEFYTPARIPFNGAITIAESEYFDYVNRGHKAIRLIESLETKLAVAEEALRELANCEIVDYHRDSRPDCLSCAAVDKAEKALEYINLDKEYNAHKESLYSMDIYGSPHRRALFNANIK